jgi:hypothetical protein
MYAVVVLAFDFKEPASSNNCLLQDKDSVAYKGRAAAPLYQDHLHLMVKSQ